MFRRNKYRIVVMISMVLCIIIGIQSSVLAAESTAEWNDTAKETLFDMFNEGKEVSYRVWIDGDMQSVDMAKLPVPQPVKQWLDDNHKQEYAGWMQLNNKTYILISRGMSASSGYGIDLKRVLKFDNVVKVKAKYIDPQPGNMYLTVITYPVLLIQVDALPDDVHVRLRRM